MGKMVDMRIEPREAKLKEKYADIAMPTEPLYPSGLCLYLDSQTCEKLDLDEDCEVGDLLDLRAMLKVTSKSAREVKDEDGGTRTDTRIEAQIVFAAVEDEDEEEPKDY